MTRALAPAGGRIRAGQAEQGGNRARPASRW
jgi:hypothetical protein